MSSTKIRLCVQQAQTKASLGAFLIIMFFMRLDLTQLSQILMHYFVSFSRAKSISDEKMHFIYGIKLKWMTQGELHCFYHFKNVDTKRAIRWENFPSLNFYIRNTFGGGLLIITQSNIIISETNAKFW